LFIVYGFVGARTVFIGLACAKRPVWFC